MKLKYVFLTVVVIFLVCIATKRPLAQYLMQKDELSFSPASCFILKNVLDTVITDNKNLYQKYEAFLKSSDAAERSADALKKETEIFATYADTYRNARLQISNAKKKQETVYVKRIASSFIMNNPAFYKRDISFNVITEKGKGADNEMLTMFYLSDGKIIKSSPKQNSRWLGMRVGEKVLKVSSVKLSFDKKKGYSAVSYTDYQPLYN